MDIALAIEKLVSGAKYRGSLTDNKETSFDKLVWEDTRKKPTWKELQAVDIKRDIEIDKRISEIKQKNENAIKEQAITELISEEKIKEEI